MSALLIVNVQRGFICEPTEHVPALAQSLQDSFNEVYASRFYNPQKSLFRKMLLDDRFALGSRETHLVFQPRESVIILDCARYSAVSASLIDRLRRSDAARVHVCGIPTETAVLASVMDLFEAGIEPVVLAHACGSPCGVELHDAGLRILKRMIGTRQIIGG